MVLGVCVALSSTAIVIQELTRHNQAHAPHGQLAIGTLLLQDLAVVVLLALTPVRVWNGRRGAGATSLPRRSAAFPAVLIGVALVARVVLPALIRMVSATGREAFSLAVLLASIGTAWLTSLAGLSMAVGAFLAGLVLAESEVSHQVHAEVRPLRDLLASLFFISVGMLVDPGALARGSPCCSASPALIVLVKAVSGRLPHSARRARRSVWRPLQRWRSRRSASSRSSSAAAPMPPAFSAGSEWQLLLGASIVTMMAAPGLVALRARHRRARGGMVAVGSARASHRPPTG